MTENPIDARNAAYAAAKAAYAVANTTLSEAICAAAKAAYDAHIAYLATQEPKP